MNKAGRLGTTLLMCGMTALAGCSGSVQESLGLGKRQPDEFQVVRRAPLVLPPDFNLRPPEPGAGAGDAGRVGAGTADPHRSA